MESTTTPKMRRPLKARSATHFKAKVEASAAVDQACSALDLMDQANVIARDWHGKLYGLLEIEAEQRSSRAPLPPLPDWAKKWIGHDKEGLRELIADHRYLHSMTTEFLRLGVGVGATTAYEVWTKRGHRLSIRHESYADAAAVLAEVDPKLHPGAFIARLNIHQFVGGFRDPALLDTLMGEVYWAGISFEDDGDRFQVQDETGRTLHVLAADLVRHPVFSRMSKEAQSRIKQNAAESSALAERQAVQP